MSTRTPEPNAGYDGSRPKAASDIGCSWAVAVRADLHREGRSAAGGWPGTMSEARSLVARSFSREELGSPEERAERVRLVYAAAKAHWLSQREAERD